MADYKVGIILKPTEELALAVAVVPAGPSPLHLEVDPRRFDPESRGVLREPPFI